jgi:hypothetical protein
VQWRWPSEWQGEDIAHGLLAGPRLLDRGHIRVTDKEERLTHLSGRDRIALAVTADGAALLVWMRHADATGRVSFAEMAAHCKALGAVDAIALDGGSSRAMFADLRPNETDRFLMVGRPIPNAVLLVEHQPFHDPRAHFSAPRKSGAWCAAHPCDGPNGLVRRATGVAADPNDG